MSTKELWPEYSFGSEEHPPSGKYNSILQILEQGRKVYGPFTISALGATGVTYQTQISSFHLKLDDSPFAVGNISGADTSTQRRFTFYYVSGDNVVVSRWNDEVFTSGDVEPALQNVWYVALTGADWGFYNMNNASESGFVCVRATGSF